jgi:L-2-hydroxyglutarate oxidase
VNPSLPERADVVVCGAGIVGLATARAVQLADPGLTVVVIDKEATVAAHQSGHNSGVIHAGLYYAPGSQKAQLCRSGRDELMAWCDRHSVEWRRCGKVVVATEPDELPQLEVLAQRAAANGIDTVRLDPVGLAEIEPHAAGLAALHVPSTAIVDFKAVCATLADGIVGRGGRLVLGTALGRVDRGPAAPRGEVVVHTSRGPIRTGRLANCAGLAADRVTEAAGDEPGAAIMPFRGEYYELIPARRHLVRTLIYPVPDPRFPFLGVHLTSMIDGSVHAGPNAVLALAREGYRWRDIDRRDLTAMATNAASWRLARRYWRTGAGEVGRSLIPARFVRALQRLVPEISREDLVRAGSGVRAQAVRTDGTLLDDFAFAGGTVDGSARVVHVVNAPSPAATASLAIGRVIADRLLS